MRNHFGADPNRSWASRSLLRSTRSSLQSWNCQVNLHSGLCCVLLNWLANLNVGEIKWLSGNHETFIHMRYQCWAAAQREELQLSGRSCRAAGGAAAAPIPAARAAALANKCLMLVNLCDCNLIEGKWCDTVTTGISDRHSTVTVWSVESSALQGHMAVQKAMSYAISTDVGWDMTQHIRRYSRRYRIKAMLPNMRYRRRYCIYAISVNMRYRLPSISHIITDIAYDIAYMQYRIQYRI